MCHVVPAYPERITRPDERFDSSQVGLHVPNCELFVGRSKYKESGLVGLEVWPETLILPKPSFS